MGRLKTSKIALSTPQQAQGNGVPGPPTNNKIRDQLAKDYGILCFQMEAAGLMDNTSVIEEARRGSSTPTVFFYCDETSVSRRAFTVLSSFIEQLLEL
ncbi:hypothetical protein ASPVEDRAFT_441024 [Aspergillus versicolor CBS 583.65]|uniref:Uncharacterized protein n=1 Tax=Aspergillus versicolor CBS 583.65 TaxID=1036611 RepID=A0A1L9P952_ASPVE|nr:uncharacterized protein ASPVEDRAFT_441024 [Aspergillus versicolor CBS 583.65]OJI98016.1 hypothetical protein ASPVEDRAFT_441024 [Aspergillus versicolor CBS 583.65]